MLFQHYMKYPAKKALTHRVYVTKEIDDQQEKKMTTYSQVVNNLLAAFATDDDSGDDKADITNFRKKEEVPAVGY